MPLFIARLILVKPTLLAVKAAVILRLVLPMISMELAYQSTAHFYRKECNCKEFQPSSKHSPLWNWKDRLMAPFCFLISLRKFKESHLWFQISIFTWNYKNAYLLSTKTFKILGFLILIIFIFKFSILWIHFIFFFLFFSDLQKKVLLFCRSSFLYLGEKG